jgi:HK97 family phage major capsid protein
MEELKKEITEKLAGIQADIHKKQEEIDGKLNLMVSKEEIGEEVKTILKGEVAELVQKHEDLQKGFDELQTENRKNFEGTRQKDIGAELHEELVSKGNKSFEQFRKGESSMAKLNLKAALVTSANASGDAVPASRFGQIFYDPTRVVRVRDFLNQIPVSGNRMQYMQETSFTNNAATRAEASAYGESEFKLDAVDSNVRSIGSTIDLTVEMLEDVPMITAYIATRLPAKILNVEDTQLLTGNGSAPNLQGLMVSGGGTAFDDASTSDFYQFFNTAAASAYVNEFDVLTASKSQCVGYEYTPNVILVDPVDYHKMLLRKDANANYVVFINGILTVFGVPIFPNTAVASDGFIIGDFRQGATMGLRDGMEVTFSYENEDNFKKDRVTVKGSERIGLAIHNPNAFAWGDFSDSITALGTG